MRTQGAADWTPEEDADLRRMWEVEGLSSGDIAYAMETTRNAIIGRVTRLKLNKRLIRAQPRLKPMADRRHSGDSAMIQRVRFKSKLLPAPLPGDTRRLQGSAWEPLHGADPVRLTDLDPGMCKWPIGEGRPFLFCGCAADGPYCPTHKAMSIGAGTLSEREAYTIKNKAA